MTFRGKEIFDVWNIYYKLEDIIILYRNLPTQLYLEPDFCSPLIYLELLGPGG